MRYGYLVLSILFLLFAYWQLNDPDWAPWVALYGFVAVVSAWRGLGDPPAWLPLLGLAAAGIWFLSLLPDFVDWVRMGAPTITGQMKAESPHVELTREFLGLSLVIAALLAITPLRALRDGWRQRNSGGRAGA